MLKALVISNAIEGTDSIFVSNKKIEYTINEITHDFDPELSGYDILIVPNGSDNIAMFKIREKIKRFLDEGNILFCFDGWFTNWVPGNKWVMDNNHKTIDIRYHIKNDKNNIMQNIDLNKLIFSHGISGWWACGYIETGRSENVILADTWNRPIVVLDEKSTNGIIFLTASAPMADMGYGANNEGDTSWGEVSKLYQNLINLITNKKENTLQMQLIK